MTKIKRRRRGRPPGESIDPLYRRVAVNVRVESWVREWLAKQDNQGRSVEAALIGFYGLKPSRKEKNLGSL